MDPKLISCLEKIQQAQGLINEAASDLSSVPCCAEEWSALCGLYDTVKGHWNLVEARRTALESAPLPQTQ